MLSQYIYYMFIHALPFTLNNTTIYHYRSHTSDSHAASQLAKTTRRPWHRRLSTKPNTFCGMKPNDTIALIVILHFLVLAVVSYGLVRVLRGVRTTSASSWTYSTYTSPTGSRSPPSSPGRPVSTEQVPHRPGPGGRVNLPGPHGGGRVNVPRPAVGGRVNLPVGGPGGRVNVPAAGPGGRVNVPEGGPGGRINVPTGGLGGRVNVAEGNAGSNGGEGNTAPGPGGRVNVVE